MRRITLVVFFLLAAAGPAHAVTLRELVDLRKAGLSDDILIALVEADKSWFQLTAKDVEELKQAGLSDKVLLHLIQTPERRRAELAPAPVAAPEPPPAPAPRAGSRETVVVVERERAHPVVVPVFIPVVSGREHHPKPREEEKPVYWGFGGKLRPGSWKDR